MGSCLEKKKKKKTGHCPHPEFKFLRRKELKRSGRHKEDVEQTNTSLYRCMIRFIVDRAVVFSQKLRKRSWRTSFRQAYFRQYYITEMHSRGENRGLCDERPSNLFELAIALTY